MKCTLVKFLKYVIGSSLVDIVKIEKYKDLKLKDVDRGSDCEVRWASKTSTSKLNLIDC